MPTSVLAEDEICFDKANAAKLAAELQTCKDTEDKIGALIEKYTIEVEAAEQSKKNLEERYTLLEDNYEDCTEKGKELDEKWQTANDAATECQKSKPSRWTWFSIGAGSGLGIALLLLAL